MLHYVNTKCAAICELFVMGHESHMMVKFAADRLHGGLDTRRDGRLSDCCDRRN